MSTGHDPEPVLTLRPARLDDAEAIRQIYNVEVTTSTVTFDILPRTLEEQVGYLTDRSGAHAVVVAEDRGEVERLARTAQVVTDEHVEIARVDQEPYRRACRRCRGH